MVAISMDGPTMNWNVLELMNNMRRDKELPEIADIGSCTLHIMHGAFKTGLKKVLQAGMYKEYLVPCVVFSKIHQLGGVNTKNATRMMMLLSQFIHFRFHCSMGRK